MTVNTGNKANDVLTLSLGKIAIALPLIFSSWTNYSIKDAEIKYRDNYITPQQKRNMTKRLFVVCRKRRYRLPVASSTIFLEGLVKQRFVAILISL